MEFVLPVLILLGLSGLLFSDSGSSTAGDVAGDSGSSDDADQPDTPTAATAPVTNFLDLTAGDDTEQGTDGDDLIRAFDGDDTVTGGAGDDRVFLGAGNDFSAGNNEGDDLTRGGDGDDAIMDDAGADTIYGDLGADLIMTLDAGTGDDEADTLFGGFGNDILIGDEGDEISGGGGNDAFAVRWDNEGEPTTITDYEARERIELEIPAIFDGSELTITPDEAGENTLINVGDQTAIILEGVTDPETVNISLFGREIVQTADEDSDLIAGTDGDDTIDTGLGQDIAYGGAGDDTIDGGRETDVLYGGSGDDVIAGNSGDDLIRGGTGDDLIKAGAGNDIVVDRDGNDTVRGGSENDIVDVRDLASDGADEVTLGTGDDAVLADDGDLVKLGAGNDLAVVSVEDVTDDPVTIKDFDPAEDTLNIAMGDGTGTITLGPVNNGADTLVTVDGQEVAILARISLTTAANINVVALIPEATS